MDVQEALQFTGLLAALHLALTLAMWGVYGALHRRDAWPAWRIDAGKEPPDALAQTGRRHQVLVQLGFAAFVGFVVYPGWSWMGGTMDSEWPGFVTLAWQLLVCILAQDTLFYWSHRALHHKTLFRAIHRRHHAFRHVRAYMATHAHPVEDLANVVAFFLPPILMGVSWQVFAIWVALRVWETCEAHSGYGFTSIASRHAFHHLHATKGCLGSFFGLWDRVMGTDAHWREWVAKQTHR